jgi:hypothetical protein
MLLVVKQERAKITMRSFIFTVDDKIFFIGE